MTINGCYIVYRRGIIKSRNKEAKNIGGESLNVKEVLLEDVLDVPEKKVKQLQNKGIYTVGDMLRFLPRRYEDRSKILTAKELPKHIGEKIALVGTVDSIYSDYAKNFLSINLKLDNGLKFSVKWFHQNYLAQQFATGEQYFFYGKLEFNEKFGYGITSPLYFSSNIESGKTPLPIYSKISGMSDDYLKTCISQCLELLNTSKTVNDPIDDEMRAALQIEDENGFFNDAHQPDSLDAVARCHRRIAAESLIPFAWGLLDRKYQGKAETDKIISKATSQVVTKQFEAGLPYTLTTDQHNTVHEMLSTIESGKRLDALVQGDVGCGKTIVAIEMACVMAKAGFQTAVMAPTSILAEQHYHEFTEQLRKFNIPICYISGKMKAKEKKEAYAQIACGAALVVIGTQAVIGKDVVFHNLGLTIVDEEHRFGVVQRKLLREKAMEGAHAISMSATPIPRSIALALYGDSTVIYNIKTMPSGRKPVKTIAYTNEERTYEATYRQIQCGRQAYVICPMISASDAVEGVDSLEETYEKCKTFFEKYPKVKIGCINGKMKPDEIKKIIDEFAAGSIHILLSTTIVEVGVNVPNATVIVIKNAERFGLAQLHQLRGRVGRGTEQAFCVLLSRDKENPRLQAMVRTNDGFEIAKEDLEQRGAGNLVGNEQSGFDEALDMMVTLPELYKTITSELDKIFQAKVRYEHYAELAAK